MKAIPLALVGAIKLLAQAADADPSGLTNWANVSATGALIVVLIWLVTKGIPNISSDWREENKLVRAEREKERDRVTCQLKPPLVLLLALAGAWGTRPQACQAQVAANTNAVPRGDVRIVRSGRDLRVFNAAADTNAARGTALREAIAAATSGDVVELGPKTYSVSGSYLVFPAGVKVTGLGKDRTKIEQSYEPAFDNPIQVRGGSIVEDLWLAFTAAPGANQRGVGPGTAASVEFWLRRCKITGDSDGICLDGYFAICHAEDCEIITGYDTFAALGTNLDSQTAYLDRCTLTANGNLTSYAAPSDSGTNHSVTCVNVGGGAIYVRNCTLTAIGKTSQVAVCGVAVPRTDNYAQVIVSDTAISSSGSTVTTDTDFATDTFTGSDSTSILSHAADLGGTWVANGAAGGSTNATIQSNRLTGGDKQGYMSPVTPPSADYSFTCVVRPLSDTHGSNYLGWLFRYSASARTGYEVIFNGDENRWVFRKNVAGSLTDLAFSGTADSETLTLNTNYTCKLVMSGSSFKFYVNDVVKIDAVDTTFSAAGKFGLLMIGSAFALDTLHVYTSTAADNTDLKFLDSDGGPGFLKVSGGTGSGTNGTYLTSGRISYNTANPGSQRLLGKLIAANFNSTSDQSIPIGSSKYVIDSVVITDGSVDLTTAVGGIYTSTGKGGVAIVAASQAYSSLTAASKTLRPSLDSAAAAQYFTGPNLYFSLTTPKGSAATGNIFVYGRDLTQ